MIRTAIVSNARRSRRIGRALILSVALALTACYPRYDWRDVRPDCDKYWCGFTASFPGKIRSATREVPVGSGRLALTVHVVSVGDVTFAVTAFDLPPGADGAAARAVLERKMLEDVGAPAGRHGRAGIHALDHTELALDTFDADGTIEGRLERGSARFVERRGHLLEMLVIGPVAELDGPDGRQALETFFTSLRVD